MAAKGSKTKPANTNGSRPTANSVSQDSHQKSRNPSTGKTSSCNRHTLPWGTYGSSRPSADTADASPGTDEPPAQQQQPPPTSHTPAAATDHMVRGDENTGDNNTPEEMPPSNANPHSSSSDLEVDRATPDASPAEDHHQQHSPTKHQPRPAQQPGNPGSHGNRPCHMHRQHSPHHPSSDTRHDATMGSPADPRVGGCADGRPDSIHGDPPRLPDSTQHTRARPLAHRGRALARRTGSPDAANTAPPFTTGLVGIFSPLASGHPAGAPSRTT